jgi:hypothetical protein
MLRWELPSAIRRDGESLFLTAFRCVEEDTDFRVTVRIRKPVCLALNRSSKLQRTFFAMIFECSAESASLQRLGPADEQADVPLEARQTTLKSEFLDWRCVPEHEMHPQHRAILEQWTDRHTDELFLVDTDADREVELYRAHVVEGLPEGTPLARRGVFISYSHKDAKHVEEFTRMLAPVIRSGAIDVWSDERISPGDRWREEISRALSATRIAVLFVSQHFLASEFIAQHELPPLLDAAERQGVTIFWICLGPCLFEKTRIADYQAAHDVSRPLSMLDEAPREAAVKEICEKLLELSELA